MLVNSDSARLQIVTHPIALERTHIMMNKFRRSNDADYERVVGEIDSIRRNLRLPADTEILENSYTPEKLRIERLSGQLLTMDKCYINLAIVEDINESGNSPMINNIREQDYHLSLLGRLSVEEPDEDLEVLLSELFNKRGNQNTQPRRILIRGRAGVGKTTLCKKIVHDFKNGTLWPELFDRLLWVPLRNLKQEDRKIAGYSYGHLFHHEYFSHHLKWKTLTEELLERVNTRDGRTLFLLDGLDEVLRSSEPSSDVSQFIKEVLNKDDVIITSRPYSTLYPHMHPVDLELETIGFYPDQVQDYLRMSFPGEDNGKKLAEIRLFLEEHQLLQGLLRIPIQLDAFCYTWEDVTEEKAPQTMTAVYQAVEKALWKKDFCRLKNLPLGSAQTSRPEEMERHFVKNELALLEVLAFAGLYSDVVNYEPIHQDAIAELEECNALVEYFAARYFVRQWEAQKPLNCQTFRTPDNQHTENYQPTAFLQRHKYNARYDIMWRFVAGLLVSEPKPNTNINCFFDAIVKEPHDLLGPAHYRLIMHCLHEVTREGESEDFTPLRAEMEGQLQRWLPPEYAQSWLVGEVEFPHRVINNMLEEATEGERWHLLRALLERAVIHPDTTNLICRQLRENNSRRTKIAVICIVRMGHHALLEEPIPLITDLIKDDDCVSLIAGRIKNDTDGYVRWTAVDVLAKQQHLPEQIIQSILGWLTEGEIWLPEKEIWLVEEEKWLLEELRHGGEQNRVTKILDSFSSKPKLFNLAIQILTARVEDNNENLEDDNKDVRKATIEALIMRPDLPNQVVRLIVGWLEDSNEDVRHAATKALVSQLGLPDQVIHSIADRLGDISEPVRNATIEFLRRHSDLPHQVIQSIADRLDNIQEGVRRTALDALGTQEDLLPKFVQLIADQLGDSEESIRYAALRALRRTNLPDEVVKLVADRLDDDDNEFVRVAAREALGQQSDLPEPAIQSIMNRIDDSWKDAQSESFAILKRQPKLSEQVIQFISNRLNHTDTEIRHEAATALMDWPGLQDRLLLSIKDRLDDIEIDVKRSTIYALASRTNLPDHLLN
ncbi:hypothetical protein NUW58_g4180 [Xylaria curta]|uniref:Uncharacterized protein n=1 Tax=Xylaria curta TaxID=42375 RepID=A0ACC1P7H8_9PEZI|nr:hypothetical protein NUW58_g4180 [Xylaria curta]